MDILRESDFTSHGKDMVWEALIQNLDEQEIVFNRDLDEDINVEVSKSIVDVMIYKDDLVDDYEFNSLVETAKLHKTPYGDDWVIVKPVSVS